MTERTDLSSLRIKRQTLGRVTSMVMALCFVYQWGACPCGCLEHNAWLRWLGVVSHDHDHAEAAFPGAPSVASSEDHDCTGRPPAVWTKSKNSSLRIALLSSRSTSALGMQPLQYAVDRRIRRELRGPPALASPRDHLLALQVFLL